MKSRGIKHKTSRIASAPTDVMEGAMPSSPDLSPTSQRLLRIAQDVSRDHLVFDMVNEARSPLSEFVQTYREWIATNRGKAETQQEQAEQWQLIMYAMVAAPTVEEAIHRLIRFGRLVWGERRPTELRREGDHAVLVFTEPFRAGPEGLIAAIWLLALTVCELEFLANARLGGLSGRVEHDACLPDSVVRLLFAPPIQFGSDEVALLIPAQHLRRPITARPSDLPRFFGELLPLTLGATREPPPIHTMVSGLIRDDKQGPDFGEPTLANIAARLAMSSATLRRRLADEGMRYRSVRDEAYNRLAKEWLAQPDISIEAVAGRLDYSDSFAFRRFFRRLNGISPSAFRDGL